MSDLGERLVRLGLAQYGESFANEGFDTWETLLDITESDLSHLGVKLGHRRKLQRAIAEYRGQSSERPLPIALARTASIDGLYRSDDSAAETKGKRPLPITNSAGTTPSTNSTNASGTNTGTKRKYRRHPKADENAPERPPSAYVIFSNRVREQLKGQDLSFTEIAKVVGERWQVVSTEEREACESQANNAKETYYSRLAEYKKTSQYEAYQKYLEEFRAKHAAPTKGKRSKLETETSTNSARSNSQDQAERPENRKLSLVTTDSFGSSYRSEQSPPTGHARPPAVPSIPSKSASPGTYPVSGYKSPRMVEYSPKSGSPRLATTPKDGTFDSSASHLARDFRGQMDLYSPYPPAPYTATHHHPPPAAVTPHPYASQYSTTTDRSSRRPIVEYTKLPPLTHEDTTLSSESGHSSYSLPSGFNGQSTPIDAAKSSRVLPQPNPRMGSSSSSQLDRPLPSVAPPGPAAPILPPPHDYRHQGPLAVLARAGEMMNVTTEDGSKQER